MSRDSVFFTVHDIDGNTQTKCFGRNTVAKFLREQGCRFDDRKLQLIGGDRAVVFFSRDKRAFVVDEDSPEDV